MKRYLATLVIFDGINGDMICKERRGLIHYSSDISNFSCMFLCTLRLYSLKGVIKPTFRDFMMILVCVHVCVCLNKELVLKMRPIIIDVSNNEKSYLLNFELDFRINHYMLLFTLSLGKNEEQAYNFN